MVGQPNDYCTVVMASGKGNRMPALTEHIPKLLLPVANLPLYWYPLNMLQRNGFKECILVVPNNEHAEIQKAVKSLPSLENLNIEVISINEDEIDEIELDEMGTADVIRVLLSKGKLNKENVLIISGDLVSDLSIGEMLKFHEEQISMLTCLLSNSALGGAVPGPKERHKKYRDLVAYSPESIQLLYMMDEEDYRDEEDLSASLFKCSPRVQLTAKFKDVHIYAIKKKALEGLTKESSYSSLKADLIPHLLNGQYSKSKRESLGIDHPYKCFAYFHTKEDCSMLAQCNHIGAYFEANKAVLKLLPKIHPKLAKREFDKTTLVNCSDSLVSNSAIIGQKSLLKRSIIGDRCEIGQNVKIDNSIIMADVIVQNGATIKNSIIFQDVQIGEKADLGMCIVIPGQKLRKSKIIKCHSRRGKGNES